MPYGSVDKFLGAAADLLGPRRCCWCHRRIARGDGCTSCLERLPWNRIACIRCALPLAGPAGTDRRCPACATAPPPQDCSFAPLLYEPPVSAQILDLKFHARLQLAPVLAGLLAAGLVARPAPLPALLIPVPLHPARLSRRGYNQALEVGRSLARRLAIELAPSAAVRKAATREQTRLSAARRRRNVRGAFAVDPMVCGRPVALLDDVITTGATAAELARTARRAGATRVEVWAVARAALSP